MAFACLQNTRSLNAAFRIPAVRVRRFDVDKLFNRTRDRATLRCNRLVSNGVGGRRLISVWYRPLNVPRIGLPAVPTQKPLGRVLGFGCEDAWGQQITQSDPSQHLGANPI